MEQKYIIEGGKKGATRLELIMKTTWASSKHHILKSGLKEGDRVLDIGCGNGIITEELAKIVGEKVEVVGIDFDKNIITIAKNNLQKSNLNIAYKINDPTKENMFKDNKFDFIHSRYFLTHINNPINMIRKLSELLTNNGILYIEDIDYSGIFSYPTNSSFDKYVEFYTKLSQLSGGNPYIGKELYNLLFKTGYNNINIQNTNHAFSSGIGKLVNLETLKNISSKILTYKLSTKIELTKIINDLNNFSLKEDNIISLPRLFYVWGYK